MACDLLKKQNGGNEFAAAAAARCCMHGRFWPKLCPFFHYMKIPSTIYSSTMQACSAHDIVPDGSSGKSIDAIAADDVKLSGADDGFGAPRMQAQSVVEMNSFPVHKLRTVLNPLDSLFHLFISYRAATDSKLSLDLHDRLQVLISKSLNCPAQSAPKISKRACMRKVCIYF